MPATAPTASTAPPRLAIDSRPLLFSLSSFVAAAATLGIAFACSLPRPWWALLTVYVTAQPMSGAFRPKILYRLAGILTGAIITLFLVPNLQGSPMLLVLCMAAWTGLCIYVAVLDRTPRAFLFQMAAFSSAVISFPYLDDPADIFTTTIARVEEMTVAIVCVSMAHALIQPWSAIPVIRKRAETFLAHAARWTAEALGNRHTRLEYEHRRMLAADVTELGMIAIHLPFDQHSAPATQRLVLRLQEKLAMILPLATAAANRLDLLRAGAPVDAQLTVLLGDVRKWLAGSLDAPESAHRELAARCRLLTPRIGPDTDWRALLTASFYARVAEFIEAHREASALVRRIGAPGDLPRFPEPETTGTAFPLVRDHSLAALAGAATATALALYCLIWIGLAWPNGSATAAFAALITCSFASQDDPAPVIRRYLTATLLTFPLAAFYLFIVLPRVDGCAMLIVTLAPALLAIGYLQAEPRYAALALPMFSCLIVALGFLDRFQIDFAGFLNTGLAQVGGIVSTLAVTRLFRSVSVRWSTRRIIRDNWGELADLANIRRPFELALWTGKATDRLEQIAARMALAAPNDPLHDADALHDLRIGRNLIALRQALTTMPHDTRRAFGRVLSGASTFFRERHRTGGVLPAPGVLLQSIDRALSATLATAVTVTPSTALLALVAIRCNLFPTAAPFQAMSQK